MHDYYADDLVDPGISSGIMVAFVVLHTIGIVVFIINALYLLCTRGYGSVKTSEHLLSKYGERLNNTGLKRRCQLRNGFAINCLIVYHTLLTVVGVIFTLMCEFQDIFESQYLKIMWNYGVISYCILLVLVVPYSCVCNASKTRAHIGPIHACVALDFLHFAIFWALFITLMWSVHRLDHLSELLHWCLVFWYIVLSLHSNVGWFNLLLS